VNAINQFRFPGGDSRTTLIGATGTGKTTCAVWLWSHMRLDVRPWIVIDFKQDRIFDEIGIPPLEEISLASVPKNPGAYIVSPTPGGEEQLENWLWKVWERENVGLLVDEAALMPDGAAWQAILQQGRSKRIPVIACTQRPVFAKRALFSEASFFGIYRLQDRRDARIIEGFVPADLSKPLPEHQWRWYDVAKNKLLRMGPVPPPELVAERMRETLPTRVTLFGNFTKRPGRGPLSRIAG
jgi:hypothetical protein